MWPTSWPSTDGKLGLVVHQAHQLARDVDVAAGHREGVHHRRVQGRDREGAVAAPRYPGRRGDLASDRGDVVAARAGLGAAEFGNDLRMLLCGLARSALRNGARRLLGDSLTGEGDDAYRRRERQKRSALHVCTPVTRTIIVEERTRRAEHRFPQQGLR
jgi:hypothetical protein